MPAMLLMLPTGAGLANAAIGAAVGRILDPGGVRLATDQRAAPHLRGVRINEMGRRATRMLRYAMGVAGRRTACLGTECTVCFCNW